MAAPRVDEAAAVAEDDSDGGGVLNRTKSGEPGVRITETAEDIEIAATEFADGDASERATALNARLDALGAPAEYKASEIDGALVLRRDPLDPRGS